MPSCAGAGAPPRPGQIVIWDNLSVHKSAAAQRLLAARGCHLLWLPPYSPDFTPIEQAFSKLKRALRRIGARTRDGAGEGDHGRAGHDHRDGCPGMVRPWVATHPGPTDLRTALMR